MAFNLLGQVVKSPLKLHNGILCAVRMCNKDINLSHSPGQPSKQSQEATYAVPEYFQHNEYSFNDINREMDKYRLPRPSSLPPKNK
ncbi:complex I-9kD [Caerostris extrusa]|uniref:Complex I-9kD n=1 Tax=Caerostris extrusa TaxID=172846 RepID=A0AAV4NK76_CAEEX|nr:complex I-9kD [Caerostris extrusa]